LDSDTDMRYPVQVINHIMLYCLVMVGSMDAYRRRQQWDAASLPDPVIAPLQSYRKLMDPPTERWPLFPTFDQRTLANLV
jgi:hypothetical protein